MHNLAAKVKNLILFEQLDRGGYRRAKPSYANEEQWLVREILGVFTGVELLVMANRLHNRDDDKEQMIWMGEEYEMVEGPRPISTFFVRPVENVPKEEIMLSSLLCWGSWGLGKGEYVYKETFNNEWDLCYGTSRQPPNIVRRNITSVTAKEEILAVCDSESGLHKFNKLDWGYIHGRVTDMEGLELSKQIDYLELVLRRTCLDEVDKEENMGEILTLQYKIDALAEEEGVFRQ